MTKYYIRPFAEDGDRTAIPTDDPIDGSISYETGWGIDYQKTLGTDPDAKPISRDQTNQLFFDVTANIQQYQQHGVPNFISTSDNGGVPFPYDIYAIVLYDDMVNGPRIYQSLEDANEALPTDTTKWRWLDPAATFKPGDIKAHASSTVEAGWLDCDGSVVSQTTYAALYAVIGVLWNTGGEGAGNFRLPNFQRSVAMGSGGTGSGTIGNAVGDRGGAETHTLIISEMPAHSHEYGYQATDSAGGGDASPIASLAGSLYPTTSQGGGAAHNIVQTSKVVLMIIKY